MNAIGLWAATAGGAGTVNASLPYDGDRKPTVVFDIPKMTAKDALMRFAQKTSIPLLVSFELVTSIEANALIGEFTVADGLHRLFSGTGLVGTIERGVIGVRIDPVPDQRNVASRQGNNHMSETKRKKAPLLKRMGTAIAAAIFATSGGAAIAAEAAEAADDEVIEEIVVTGIRGSLRRAIDRKRNADSIIDALVAEDIGKFPDQNLAESLQRISGVAIDRMRGEGASVSIRGLGSQFTRVLVNGRTALTGGSQSFAGNIGDSTQNRSFRFESMQAELVQAVEVHKSAKANLLEAGMGGTINIRTRRPFDNGGQRILAANAFVTDDELADDNGYRFAAIYSDSWNDELGFLVSVAGDDRTLREDWFNIPDYRLVVFNNAVDLNGVPLPTCTLRPVSNPNSGCAYAPGALRQGVLVEDNKRLNLSAALQWRPNEQWDVTVDVLHSDLDRDHEDYQSPWSYQSGLSNGASIVQMDENNIATYIRTESSRPRPFQRPRHDMVENQTFAVNATFTPSEKWTMSFDVAHSIGDRKQARQDTYYQIFGVPLVYDARDSYLPKITVEADLLDPTLYNFIIYAEGENNSGDEETQYRYDATYHFDDGFAFHAGISYRDRVRTWQRRALSFGPRRGHFTDGEVLMDVEYERVPVDGLFSGISGSQWPDAYLLASVDSVRQTYFIDRRDEIPDSVFTRAETAHAEDFDFWEETLSVYFMADFGGSIGDVPWSGNMGLRWTSIDRASNGNVQPVDAVVYSDLAGLWSFDLGPAEFQEHSNRLAELLPSLNLKFDITDDLVGRFFWGKTMTQPSFTQLNPGGTKHASTRRVQEGDPELNPYIAEQLDIGLEWYPTDDAIFAVHAFGKEVDEFIIQVSEQRDWIDPATGGPLFDPESGENVQILYQGPANTDGAFIGGVEVAAQYLFTNLPAPFDGLGFQFNHTWVTTDAAFSNTLRTATFPVPGLSENTTNMVLFYEKDRISTRVAWNKREGFLTQVQSFRGSPQYTSDYSQLDAGFSYNITDNISVLVEGINLTDESVDQYNIVGPVSRKEQLFIITNSGRRLQAGIRARF